MHANSFYCSISSEGKFLEFSPSWTEYLGINQLELLKQNIHDFIYRDDVGVLKKTLDQSVQQRFPKDVELRLMGQNQELKQFFFSILYLSREGRFVLFGDDLTHLNELSQRQTSVSQLNEESYGISYWEYNLKTKHLYANLHDRLVNEKKDIEEVIKFFQELHHDNEGELIRSQILKALDNGKSSTFIAQNIEIKKFNRFTIKKSLDQYLLTGFLRDVTEEVLKEKVYLDKNIELSSFEKGLDQFTIVARTDAKGRITYANEAFCKISKYEMDELLGRDHRILNSGSHSKDFFERMWKHIKEGRSWRDCIKNKAKDGSFYWVDTIIIPIMDSEGHLMEILSFRYEVTEYFILLQENKRLKELLERKNGHL